MIKTDESKRRSGYMTTTELARLCGVSRFTIINWTKQGRIKAIRTVGKHYRIPVSEALSLLKTFGRKEKAVASGLPEHDEPQVQTTNDDEDCGNCLTSDRNIHQTKRKNFLYTFGYGIGRGMNVLKERSKIK